MTEPNDFPQNTPWVCPKDQTINNGNYCSACGTPRPNNYQVITTKKSKKKHRAVWFLLGALLLVIGFGIGSFLGNRSNPLYGYYACEEVDCAISIEKKGQCHWYQEGICFDGTYTLQKNDLQFHINGSMEYVDIDGSAKLDGTDLLVDLGSVKRFVRSGKNAPQDKDYLPASKLHTSEDPRSIKALVTGDYHLAILRNNGRVMAYGKNEFGQCNVREWSGIVDVQLGPNFTIGLRDDHTVVAAGVFEDIQWTDIQKIAVKGSVVAGLRSDGTVVAGSVFANLGSDGTITALGLLNLSEDIASWRDIQDIAAGTNFLIGLKKDGTVVAAGDNQYGQCNVQSWTDIAAIATGEHHVIGVKKDGTVISIGWNNSGECDLQSWSDIVEVKAGIFYTIGKRKNGTLVAAGSSVYCSNIPAGTDIADFYCGPWDALFLHKDGTVSSSGSGMETNVMELRGIKLMGAGVDYTAFIDKYDQFNFKSGSDFADSNFPEFS